MQRRIERLLDEGEAAADQQDWATVRRLAGEVLAIDPENEDAPALRRMADASAESERKAAPPEPAASEPVPAHPSSFVAGRYRVERFLGEGGRKRVFLAHDSRLDRNVAFALVRSEGLDVLARERATCEAQAMGRLGAHPTSCRCSMSARRVRTFSSSRNTWPAAT